MPIKAHNLPAAFIKRHADNDHLFQNEFDVSMHLTIGTSVLLLDGSPFSHPLHLLDVM